MARPWTPIDATQAGLFAEQGYGQGAGQTYQPWLDKEETWRYDAARQRLS